MRPYWWGSQTGAADLRSGRTSKLVHTSYRTVRGKRFQLLCIRDKTNRSYPFFSSHTTYAARSTGISRTVPDYKNLYRLTYVCASPGKPQKKCSYSNYMYGVGRVLNVNKPFQTSHADWRSCMPINAYMSHVLQSGLVPRSTILLKSGTEAISELEVTECTAVCYLFHSVLCLICDQTNSA